MHLNYFNDTDSIDDINREYKRLSKLYHPDINKDINENEKMKAINVERDYVLQHRQEPAKKESSIQDEEFLRRVAQNIFHALTNAKGVDYNLLVSTINKITYEEVKPITSIYFRTYGFDLVKHIQSLVKDKTTKDAIITFLNVAKENPGIFNLVNFLIKNFR